MAKKTGKRKPQKRAKSNRRTGAGARASARNRAGARKASKARRKTGRKSAGAKAPKRKATRKKASPKPRRGPSTSLRAGRTRFVPGLERARRQLREVEEGVPTPPSSLDLNRVDEIGKALGVEYQDNEELKGADKIAERDRKRWELDPASSEDYRDREKS